MFHSPFALISCLFCFLIKHFYYSILSFYYLVYYNFTIPLRVTLEQNMHPWLWPQHNAKIINQYSSVYPFSSFLLYFCHVSTQVFKFYLLLCCCYYYYCYAFNIHLDLPICLPFTLLCILSCLAMFLLGIIFQKHSLQYLL